MKRGFTCICVIFLFTVSLISNNYFAKQTFENKEEVKIKNPNVKILVSYHRPAKLLKSDVFVPIHVGRDCQEPCFGCRSGEFISSEKDKEWLKLNLIGDNTGENISILNRKYGEMTAVYWAWKNLDSLGNPDYIGLYHFNKYFNLDTSNTKPLTSCEFTDTMYVDPLNCDKKIYDIICNRDIIVPKPVRRPNIIEGKHYQCIKMLLSYSSYESFLNVYEEMRQNKIGVFKNLFIMKQKLFKEYCEYIFPLFDIALRWYPPEEYGRHAMFLMERVTGRFLYSKSIDQDLSSTSLGIFEMKSDSIIL